MPKQTFFNLPDDKRNQILDVVLDEFAENDYDSVSISRIVARAGIAKGSFYQYFDGKEDLYRYLIDLLVEAKTRAFSLDHPDPQHVGVFNYLRWALENSVEFELSHPRLSRIGYRLLKSGPSKNQIMEDAIEGALAYYRNLVLLGKEQGDIAPDIDVDVAAAVFNLVMSEMGRQIINQAIADHNVVRLYGGNVQVHAPGYRARANRFFRGHHRHRTGRGGIHQLTGRKHHGRPLFVAGR